MTKTDASESCACVRTRSFRCLPIRRLLAAFATVEPGVVRAAASVCDQRTPLKDERSLPQGMPGAEGSAEIHFRQALHGAREYGVLPLELRAAASLARLLRNQGCRADATGCLKPIYDRFTEGFSARSSRG